MFFPLKKEHSIAFSGISLKSWVTYHGIAVNINNDISIFKTINPCGDKNIKVTSASLELGQDLKMACVKKIFVKKFISTFEDAYKIQINLLNKPVNSDKKKEMAAI